jgi:fluoride exporter
VPRHPAVIEVGWVAVGGGLGSAARWQLGEWFSPASGPLWPALPWTTLAINVVGAFLLAALPGWSVVRHRPLLALALGPGVLGGFTTLSTYSEETRTLLANGRVAVATGYAAGTLAACLIAVHAGRMATEPGR